MAHCLSLFTLVFLLSCASKKQDYEALAQADSTAVQQVVLVQTVPAQVKTFDVQVMSNGKVVTGQEVPLAFRGVGVITQITVKNGATVKAGQLMAALQNEEQKLAVKEARLQWEESKVEINDLLITQGGKGGDSASVSEEVYRYIKLKSGNNRAWLALQKAQLELAKTYLYAPVSGTVANLMLSAFSPTPADKPFCTIINRNQVLVRCPILESELAVVQPGQQAGIRPIGIPGDGYSARVMDINPMIDAQGLTQVTLQVTNPDSKLLSGMNVGVIIRKPFPHTLVVPKTAVIERGGRKVLFTLENNLAKWHYVTTGQQNDKEIVITEGLEKGEQVIVSGNVNLGHDAKVKKE